MQYLFIQYIQLALLSLLYYLEQTSYSTNYTTLHVLPWSRKIGWIFSHFYSSYNKNLISPINKLLYRRSSGAHACAYQISESVHGFVLVVLFVYTLHILIFSRNKKVISIKFLLIFPLLSITRYTQSSFHEHILCCYYYKDFGKYLLNLPCNMLSKLPIVRVPLQ